jgi:peptidoglycan/xylan/chitin deacetylase (PgdA/CDA1 family)
MSLLKPVMHLLSPRGNRGKLLIFIFHRVLAETDPLLPSEPDAVQFDWMIRLIGKNFNVLPFGRAVALLQSGTLPAATACITFDDGYKDNCAVALPILRRHGLVATFFIATGFLGGGRMWNDDIIAAVRALVGESVDWTEFGLDRYGLSSHDERLNTITAVLGRLKYLPHGQREVTAREIARRAGVDDKSELMMSADDVREVRAAGMELGGHTSTHPILNLLSDDEAYSEIRRGKSELEEVLSEPVNVFAYPNGNPRLDLSSRHIEMLRDVGFVAAATTERRVASMKTDPFLMPRFTPWDRTPAKFAARCALALAGRT